MNRADLNTAGAGAAASMLSLITPVTGSQRRWRLWQQRMHISSSHCLTKQLPHCRVNWCRLWYIHRLTLTTITSTLHIYCTVQTNISLTSQMFHSSSA